MSSRRPPERGKPFGLDHYTWPESRCFYYDSIEEATAAILRVYGPDAEHVVVERRIVWP